MIFSTTDGDIEFSTERCIVAGWTGRDEHAVKHHIDELAALGISPPSSVPLYYQVSNTLLTHKSTIDVLGSGTSGEVEPLLIQKNGKRWIGLASDHTDRDLEAHSVAASKQICLKPTAQELWPYDDVADHLDSLILRCSIKEQGEWVSYQEGTLSNLRPLAELMVGSRLQDNSALLCGTLPAIGGVRPATEYKMELEDPIRDIDIYLEYQVNVLPLIE